MADDKLRELLGEPENIKGDDLVSILGEPELKQGKATSEDVALPVSEEKTPEEYTEEAIQKNKLTKLGLYNDYSDVSLYDKPELSDESVRQNADMERAENDKFLYEKELELEAKYENDIKETAINTGYPEEFVRGFNMVEKALPARRRKTGYLAGGAGEFDRGVADVFRAVDGATKFVKKGILGGINLAEMAVGKDRDDWTTIDERPTLWSDLADIYDQSADAGYDIPDNVMGDIVGGMARMSPDLVATYFAPTIKLGMISKLTGGAVKTVAKFPLTLAIKEAGLEYLHDPNNPFAITKGFGSGLTEGYVMESMGLIGKEAKMVADGLGAGRAMSETAAAITNGTLFGGHAVVTDPEIYRDGNIDWRKFWSGAGMGLAFHLSGIAKGAKEEISSSASRGIANSAIKRGYAEYMTSDREAVRKAFTEVKDPRELRKVSNEYWRKAEMSESEVEKNQYLMAKTGIDNLISRKMFADYVANNPDEMKKSIEEDKGLSQKEVEFFNKKIDETVEDYETIKKFNEEKAKIEEKVVEPEKAEIAREDLQVKADALKEQGEDVAKMTVEDIESRFDELKTETDIVEPKVDKVAEDVVKKEDNATTEQVVEQVTEQVEPAKENLDAKKIEPTQEEIRRTPDEITDEVITKSEDPVELATTFIEEANKPSSLSNNEQVIKDHMMPIRRESFKRLGDLVSLEGAKQIQLNYFKKEGGTIDQIVKDISMSDAGKNLGITNNDVVDFINKHPNGVGSTDVGGGRSAEVASRYKEVTGKKLTADIAKDILKQDLIAEEAMIKADEQLQAEKEFKAEASVRKQVIKEVEKADLDKSNKVAEEIGILEERGKAKIAEGFAELASAFGGKKDIVGEQRASAVKGLRKIAEGAADVALAKGITVKELVKDYVKRMGMNIPDDVIDEALLEPLTPKEIKTEKPKGVKEKDTTLGKRLLSSDKLSDKLKADIEEKGIKYAVRGKSIRGSEAEEIVKAYSDADMMPDLKAEIKDTKNGIKGDTRTSLAVKYFESMRKKANKAKDPKEADAFREEAVEMSSFGMEFGSSAGQVVEAQKEWSEALASEPEYMVASAKRTISKKNDVTLESEDVKKDIKSSKEIIDEFIKSDDFNKLVSDKVKEAKKKTVSNKERVNRGKAKVADAMDRLASLKGIKKNILSENNLNDGVISIVKDMADGFLDIGVGSTKELINKLKVATREYLKPSDIDKIYKDISKELDADNRVVVKEAKTTTLTPEQTNKLVDGIYSKMLKTDKKAVRKVIRDYFDLLSEEGVVNSESFREIYANAIGLESLTPEHEARIIEASKTINDTKAIENNLREMFDKAVDMDNAKEDVGGLIKDIKEQSLIYKKALEDTAKANKDLSESLADIPSIGTFLGTVVQGNLLTFKSLITNISAYSVLVPRLMTSSLASVGDYGLSSIGKWADRAKAKVDPIKNVKLYRLLNRMPNAERTISVLSQSKGWKKGFLKGAKDSFKQLWTGQMPEDAYNRDVFRSMKPLDAMIDNYMAVTGKKRLENKRIVMNTLESTVGVSPEIVFRLLNVGDKPIGIAAYLGRLNEIADIKKLKGLERDKFLMFPDEASAESARESRLEATYQNENFMTKAMSGLKSGSSNKNGVAEKLSNVDKSLHGTGSFIGKLLFPYIKTPSNVMIETATFQNPALGFLISAYHANNGNRRKALTYASRAVVGTMISAGIKTLFVNGIMTAAPGGDDEKDRKVKAAQYRDEVAYGMNTSAYTRFIQGRSPEYQEGDNIISIKRFGMLSSMAMGQAESYRGMTAEEIANLSFAEEVISSTAPMLKSSLDQSYLSGANGIMNAISQGGYEAEKWWVNMARAASTTMIPSWYSAVVKSASKQIDETNDASLKGAESVLGKIKNTLKGNLVSDTGLPAKVTPWGEDVKRVPDGRGASYVLFDVTEYRKYRKSDFGVKLYELYKRTKDDSVLQSNPSARIKFGGEYINLNANLWYDLCKTVGSVKRIETQGLVNSYEWETYTDDEKIEAVTELYKNMSKSNGSVTIAKEDFIENNSGQLIDLFREQHKDKTIDLDKIGY